MLGKSNGEGKVFQAGSFEDQAIVQQRELLL